MNILDHVLLSFGGKQKYSVLFVTKFKSTEIHKKRKKLVSFSYNANDDGDNEVHLSMLLSFLVMTTTMIIAVADDNGVIRMVTILRKGSLRCL